jgi:hypothetical protein
MRHITEPKLKQNRVARVTASGQEQSLHNNGLVATA